MPYRRGDIWWASVTIDGRRTRQPAGPRRADALALEAQLRAAHRPLSPHGLEAALTRYLTDAQGTRRWANARTAGRALAPHIAGLGLSPRDVALAVERVTKAGRARGLAVASINRQLALLRRLANLAFQWGWTTELVGARVKLLPGERAREVFLTRGQVAALAAAMPRTGLACIFAAHTGLRATEQASLRPGDVRDGVIYLAGEATKGGRPRAVPIPPELLPVELPWPWTRQQLRREWDIARRATGLEHVRWHDLRHTYASWLVQAGVPLYTVGQLLGHTDPKMTQRYAHLAPEPLRQAVAVLSLAR